MPRTVRRLAGHYYPTRRASATCRWVVMGRVADVPRRRVASDRRRRSNVLGRRKISLDSGDSAEPCRRTRRESRRRRRDGVLGRHGSGARRMGHRLIGDVRVNRRRRCRHERRHSQCALDAPLKACRPRAVRPIHVARLLQAGAALAAATPTEDTPPCAAAAIRLPPSRSRSRQDRSTRRHACSAETRHDLARPQYHGPHRSRRTDRPSPPRRGAEPAGANAHVSTTTPCFPNANEPEPDSRSSRFLSLGFRVSARPRRHGCMSQRSSGE